MSPLNAAYALVPLGVRRRSMLTFLGFRYDWRAGRWRRRRLSLSDEALDTQPEDAFAQRVRHWRRAPGRR